MFYIFDNVSSFGVGSNDMYLCEQNVDSFCTFVKFTFFDRLIIDKLSNHTKLAIEK